jgi:hypothetical protein
MVGRRGALAKNCAIINSDESSRGTLVPAAVVVGLSSQARQEPGADTRPASMRPPAHSGIALARPPACHLRTIALSNLN